MKCTSISLTDGESDVFFVFVFFFRISYYFQKFLEGLKKDVCWTETWLQRLFRER